MSALGVQPRRFLHRHRRGCERAAAGPAGHNWATLAMSALVTRLFREVRPLLFTSGQPMMHDIGT